MRNTDREGDIMGRYIREMELQLPESEVRELIDGFLKENGFYIGEWQGNIFLIIHTKTGSCISRLG